MTEGLKGGAMSKLFRPEIFDKSSPVNKAKVYHTGSKHYIYEINIYLHVIVLTHK